MALKCLFILLSAGGVDFSTVATQITFSADEGHELDQRHLVTVPIVDDNIDEADREYFILYLSPSNNPRPGLVLTSVSIGGIEDDDGRPQACMHFDWYGIGVGTNFLVVGQNLNYDFAKQEVANFYGACDHTVVKILNLSVNFPKDINDKGNNSNIIELTHLYPNNCS